MAGTLKKVRIKLAWQNYRVGDEFTPNGTLRDWLVGNGYADVIEAASPARPARLSHKAAAKLGEITAKLSKAAGDQPKH